MSSLTASWTTWRGRGEVSCRRGPSPSRPGPAASWRTCSGRTAGSTATRGRRCAGSSRVPCRRPTCEWRWSAGTWRWTGSWCTGPRFDNSAFTERLWQVMADGPAYANARCLIGYDESGVPVAGVTVWSAGPGRPGLLEPAGVHRDHRGHSYGTQISIPAAGATAGYGVFERDRVHTHLERRRGRHVRIGRVPATTGRAGPASQRNRSCLNGAMDASDAGTDLDHVLFTEAQIHERLAEVAEDIWADYRDKDVLLVGVLKGAILVMADLMRALPGSVPMDWMAVSSYGSGTKSSGVVRILKDLDTDISGRHVLIVEDIIDLRAHAQLDPQQPAVPGPGLPGDLHAAAQAGRRRRSPSTAGTSGSTSPTNSSSATAWTTTSATATCATSARSRRTCTPEFEHRSPTPERIGHSRRSTRRCRVQTHGGRGLTSFGPRLSGLTAHRAP